MSGIYESVNLHIKQLNVTAQHEWELRPAQPGTKGGKPNIQEAEMRSQRGLFGRLNKPNMHLEKCVIASEHKAEQKENDG